MLIPDYTARRGQPPVRVVAPYFTEEGREEGPKLAGPFAKMNEAEMKHTAGEGESS